MVSGVITRSVMQHIMHNGYFIISDIIEDTGYSVTTVAKYVAQLIEDMGQDMMLESRMVWNWELAREK